MAVAPGARLIRLSTDLMTRRGSLRVLSAVLLAAAAGDAVEAALPVRRVQNRAAKRRQRRHHRLMQKRRRQRRRPEGFLHFTDLIYLKLATETGMPVMPWHWLGYVMDWRTAGGRTVGLNTEFDLGPLVADAVGLEFYGFSEFSQSRPFLSVDGKGGSSDVDLYYGGEMSAAGYVGGAKAIDQWSLSAGGQAIGFMEAGPGQRYLVTVLFESDERDEDSRTRTFTISFLKT